MCSGFGRKTSHRSHCSSAWSALGQYAVCLMSVYLPRRHRPNVRVLIKSVTTRQSLAVSTSSLLLLVSCVPRPFTSYCYHVLYVPERAESSAGRLQVRFRLAALFIARPPHSLSRLSALPLNAKMPLNKIYIYIYM